jgi:hypothetical protein
MWLTYQMDIADSEAWVSFALSACLGSDGELDVILFPVKSVMN